MIRSIVIFMLISLALNTQADEGIYAKYLNAEVKFNHISKDSYYSCSYAEAQAKKYLKMLGAVNIQTKCTGGIQPGAPSSSWIFLSLEISYDALVAVKPSSKDAIAVEFETVRIRGNEACDLKVGLIDTLVKNMDVQVVKSSNSCYHANGRFNYEISTLKKP